MKKVALIIGISGMDGSHLADFLLSKDYNIWATKRAGSNKNYANIKHIEEKINFVNGDLLDQDSLQKCIEESNPHEIYNLGSFTGTSTASWINPLKSSEIDGLGTLRILEAIRNHKGEIRFYQASSSEMFGTISHDSANEETPFSPRSPYGISKLYGHWMTKSYRKSYGMQACSGILFNHESERRSHEFVTRKISDGVARIHLGLEKHITLGSLDSERDWGYAPDYVRAMWLMLQRETPNDYVISTGETHSVRDFLDVAFNHIGIEDWSRFIKQDKRFLRTSEPGALKGDSTLAHEELNWKPSLSFKGMVEKMVDNDIRLLRGEK